MVRAAVDTLKAAEEKCDRLREHNLQLRAQVRALMAGSTMQHELNKDAAISGGSLDGRAGLQSLLTAAAATPRPFDVLLVDDSSRVARDLADALRVLERLKFAGVRVVYISQSIDSASEQAETLVAVHGLVDGLYLGEMAQKIRRGWPACSRLQHRRHDVRVSLGSHMAANCSSMIEVKGVCLVCAHAAPAANAIVRQ